jgi:hypothetical protein
VAQGPDAKKAAPAPDANARRDSSNIALQRVVLTADTADAARRLGSQATL